MSTPAKSRATRCSPANGRCPDCLTPLQKWRGCNGAKWIGTELGCPGCKKIVFIQHEKFCVCDDCRSGIDKLHRIEKQS